MSFLLRSTKYNKWIIGEPEWLQKGEIPADPIFGLQTQSNRMSVWSVNKDRAQVERIVGALAATRESLQDFEYVLLDSEIVTNIGIKRFRKEGESPDQELNRLHLELVEISGQKLLKLTEATFRKIYQGDTELVERIPRKTVANYIVDGIRAGSIDPKLVNANVLTKVNKLTGDSSAPVS